MWQAHVQRDAGGLRPRRHALRGDLLRQFGRALHGQPAEIAADQVAAAQGDHGNEEQREPALRFHGGKDCLARAL